MSNFIKELEEKIQKCFVGDYVGGEWHEVNEDQISEALKILDDMGDNARKMLDIGIVMDDLADLGFKHEVRCSKFNIINLDCLQLLLPKSHSRYWIEVRFTKDYAYLSQTDERFFFTVENWKQDLLSKVKKLIGGEK